MICKLCQKEMDFYRGRSENGHSYDCNDCDAEYRPFTNTFDWNVGQYGVYTVNGNTHIWRCKHQGGGLIDVSIDLQGEHYNLTEERIEKLLILL